MENEMIERVARHLTRTHQEMDFARARTYVRTVIEAMREPTPEMLDAADTAVGEWRRTLTRDEALMRSYIPPVRRSHRFIASATPAEKHAIRWSAMIDAALQKTPEAAELGPRDEPRP